MFDLNAIIQYLRIAFKKLSCINIILHREHM